jgi:hypothetical protein
MLLSNLPQTIDAPDDDSAIAAGPTATVPAAGLTFGHSQYTRVPSGGNRKLSGRPRLCPYHEVMLEATLALTPHEEQQRQSLVAQLRIGRMVKGECGWYAQVPPPPIKPHVVIEDNGTVRHNGLMMRRWSQEEMLAALNPEAVTESAT